MFNKIITRCSLKALDDKCRINAKCWERSRRFVFKRGKTDRCKQHFWLGNRFSQGAVWGRANRSKLPRGAWLGWGLLSSSQSLLCREAVSNGDRQTGAAAAAAGADTSESKALETPNPFAVRLPAGALSSGFPTGKRRRGEGRRKGQKLCQPLGRHSESLLPP